jgi:TolB-like protein
LNADFEKAQAILQALMSIPSLSTEALCDAADYLALTYHAQQQENKACEIFEQVLRKAQNYQPGEPCWPYQPLMNCYYATSKRLGLPPPEKPNSRIQTIAIIDFDNNAVDEAERYQNLGKALAKIMITDFRVLSNLRVVEREKLQYVLQELNIQRSSADGQPLFDKTTTAQAGKLLGAQSFVFASFTRLGKIFRIDARLVVTETGEIFKTQAVEGKPDKAFDLAKNLTLKICSDLQIALDNIEKKKLDELGKAEIPLEAVALYGDAIAQANREQYKEAYKKIRGGAELGADFPKSARHAAGDPAVCHSDRMNYAPEKNLPGIVLGAAGIAHQLAVSAAFTAAGAA